MLMKSRALHVLLVLFLVTLIWQCAGASDLAGLEKKLRDSAITISSKLEGRVCIMDFTESSNPNYSSEFGGFLAEHFSNHLTNRRKQKYQVVARKEIVDIVRDTMVFGDDDLTIKKLTKEAEMDILISGSYGIVDDEISVNIKAVSAETGKVVDSASFHLKKTLGFEKMILHRYNKLQNPEEKPEETLTTGMLEVETGIFYEGGDGKLYPLREGMVLTSKDNYAIYVKPSRNCCLYIYQVDSSQNVFKIFPNKIYSQTKNPIEAGKEYWIPSNIEFLYLDENIGVESIYIFATQASVPSLENIEDNNGLTVAGLEDSIKTMGIGGKRGTEVIRKVKGTKGNSMELISRKLSSQGDFYYTITFIHR